MGICKKCNEKNSGEALFCTNCGNRLSQSKQQESKQTKVLLQKQDEPKSKKISSKQKMVIYVVGIVALIIVGVHIVLSNMYDPTNQISAMNEAYNNQDKEAFFKEFHMKADVEGNADSFYALVKEYGWSKLRDQLTYEVEKMKNNQNTDIIYDNGGELISLSSKPILLGLYKKVEFTIIPTEVLIYTPFKNTKIHFGSREAISNKDGESVSVGKFIPGEYKWSYTYENHFMPLKQDGVTAFESQKNNTVDIDIDWDFETIFINSNLEDAQLFINGKNTGKTVAQLEELYPAHLNSNIEIYAQSTDKDGTEVKSEIVPLNDYSIYLEFEHIRTEEEMTIHESIIKNMYENFRDDYATAISYADFNYISSYFIEGSQTKSDFAKFVKDHENIPGYQYDFILNDITGFKAISNTQFELQTFETFNYSSDEDQLTNYERKKRYVFSYNDGNYNIDEITNLETKKTKH